VKLAILLHAPVGIVQCPAELDCDLANSDNIAQAPKRKGGLHSVEVEAGGYSPVGGDPVNGVVGWAGREVPGGVIHGEEVQRGGL